MTRNGDVSFWYDEIGIPQPRPALTGPTSVDVCIVGSDRTTATVRLRFAGGAGETVRITATLFPYDPIHESFVTVRRNGSLAGEHGVGMARNPRVFLKASDELRLSVSGADVSGVTAGVVQDWLGPDADPSKFVLGVAFLYLQDLFCASTTPSGAGPYVRQVRVPFRVRQETQTCSGVGHVPPKSLR